ncbi:MAG: hypothetical protein ACI4PJ_00810 [Acutalibacteraceae bacterium]
MEKEFDKLKEISENMMQLFKEIWKIEQNGKGNTLTKESLIKLCKKHDVSLEEVQNLAIEIKTLGKFKSFSDFQSNMLSDFNLAKIAGGKFNARKGIATFLTAISSFDNFLGSSSGAFAMQNDILQRASFNAFSMKSVVTSATSEGKNYYKTLIEIVKKIAGKSVSKCSGVVNKESLYIQKNYGLSATNAATIVGAVDAVTGLAILKAINMAVTATIGNDSKKVDLDSKEAAKSQQADLRFCFVQAVLKDEITLNVNNYTEDGTLKLLIVNSDSSEKSFLCKLACDVSSRSLKASNSIVDIEESKSTAAITMTSDVYAKTFFGLENVQLAFNGNALVFKPKSVNDRSENQNLTDANLNFEQVSCVSDCLRVIRKAPMMPPSQPPYQPLSQPLSPPPPPPPMPNTVKPPPPPPPMPNTVKSSPAPVVPGMADVLEQIRSGGPKLKKAGKLSPADGDTSPLPPTQPQDVLAEILKGNRSGGTKKPEIITPDNFLELCKKYEDGIPTSELESVINKLKMSQSTKRCRVVEEVIWLLDDVFNCKEVLWDSIFQSIREDKIVNEWIDEEKINIDKDELEKAIISMLNNTIKKNSLEQQLCNIFYVYKEQGITDVKQLQTVIQCLSPITIKVNFVFINNLYQCLEALKSGQEFKADIINRGYITLNETTYDGQEIDVRKLILYVVKKTYDNEFAEDLRRKCYIKKLTELFSGYKEGIKSKEQLEGLLLRLKKFSPEVKQLCGIGNLQEHLEELKKCELEKMKKVCLTYSKSGDDRGELSNSIKTMFEKTDCSQLIESLKQQTFNNKIDKSIPNEYIDERERLKDEENAKELLDYLRDKSDSRKGSVVAALKSEIELLISGNWVNVKGTFKLPEFSDDYTMWYKCIYNTAQSSEWAKTNQQQWFNSVLKGTCRDPKIDPFDLLSQKAINCYNSKEKFEELISDLGKLYDGSNDEKLKTIVNALKDFFESLKSEPEIECIREKITKIKDMKVSSYKKVNDYKFWRALLNTILLGLMKKT